MMVSFKDGKKLFKHNYGSLIVFEIMYRLVSMMFLVPVIYFILNFSVKVAKIKCLTTGTMKRYFQSPWTYLCIFVILLIFTMYVLMNISGIMYAMECSRKEEKTNPLSMILRGVVNAFRVFNLKNIGLLGYIVFILPFSYTVMISGSLMGLRIPEFLRRFFLRNRYIMLAVVLVYLLICVLSITKIFSLNYFFLYKLNYREAAKVSKVLIKKHIASTFFGMLTLNLGFTFILVLLEGSLAAVVAGVLSKLITYKKFYFVFNNIIKIILLIVYFACTIVATPAIYAYLCAKFYRLEKDVDVNKVKEDFGIELEKRRFRKIILTKEQIERKNVVMMVALIMIGLGVNSLYVYLLKSNKISINVAYSTRASVTAHRGDSENAPENTMSAISLAVENQADIIEIDVRQTFDGELIVMHDENLYRTTDVNAKVGETSWAYISRIDAGSKFSKAYKGEKVPLFEDVLAFCKENEVFLNIEIKTAKTDKDIVARIMTMIEEYDYFDSCVFASTNYEALKAVKAINEDAKTIYIMSMALGEFGDMEYVDGFSIRHNFISDNMVRNIHKNGKVVYAWTVSGEADIKELLLMGVDSIITDDPYNTKLIIYNANDSLLSDWIQRLIKKY